MGPEDRKKTGCTVFKIVPWERGGAAMVGFGYPPGGVPVFKVLEIHRSLDDALEANPDLEIAPPVSKFKVKIGREKY